MDTTRQLSKTDSVENELINKNNGLQHPSSIQIQLPLHRNLQPKITKNKEIIDVSHDSDVELSVGEKRVIEECLIDTEASLSAVDLKFFNDLNETVATKNKKSMKKRISERRNFMFLKDNKSETSEDDAYAEQTLCKNQLLLENVIDKLYKELTTPTPQCKVTSSRSPIRRVKRIKRRSTTENIRNTHIYSFFNAMADLVSTFSHSHVSKVKKKSVVYSC